MKSWTDLEESAFQGTIIFSLPSPLERGILTDFAKHDVKWYLQAVENVFPQLEVFKFDVTPPNLNRSAEGILRIWRVVCDLAPQRTNQARVGAVFREGLRTFKL